jgi:LemA protein
MGASSRPDKIAAANQFEGAISRLMMVTEAYPNLKADANFQRLMDELAGTENRLAVERKRYNDRLQDYNTYLLQFPNNLYAGFAGYKENDAYFKAAEGSREVPKVDFGGKPAATPTPAPAR